MRNKQGPVVRRVDRDPGRIWVIGFTALLIVALGIFFVLPGGPGAPRSTDNLQTADRH